MINYRNHLHRKQLRLALTPLVFVMLSMQLAPAQAAPGDVDYDVAVKHYNRHWWQKAVDAFAAFRQAHPRHPRHNHAIFFQGEALIQLGSHKRAADSFRQFVAAEPHHAYTAQARLRIGEMLYFQEQPRAALQAFEEFIAQHPTHELNKYALPYAGELALAAGKAPLAQQHYQKALKRFPAGPMIDQCRFGLAQSLHEQGNRADALRFYQLLASNPAGPLASNAQFQIGLSHHQAGDQQQAIKALQGFNTTFSESALRYDADYWLSQAYIKAGRWKEAQATLTAQLPPATHKLAPAYAAARGLVYEQQHEPAKADAQYKLVVEKWPTTTWAADSLKQRIAAHYAAAKYAETAALAEEFEKVFPQHQHSALVRRAWGRSLLKLKKYNDAIPHFRYLTADDAEAQTETQRTPDRYYLARALSGAGQHEETLTVLAEIKPASTTPELAASILATHTSALMALKKHQQAVELLDGFLQENGSSPAAPDARLQLALALTHTGKLKKAGDTLKQVPEDHPLRAAAMLFLAETAYAATEIDASPASQAAVAQAAAGKEIARYWFTQLNADGIPPEYAVKARSGLAWLNASEGNHQKSAELFNQVLTADATGNAAAEAAMMRGQALEKSRSPPKRWRCTARC